MERKERNTCENAMYIQHLNFKCNSTVKCIKFLDLWLRYNRACFIINGNKARNNMKHVHSWLFSTNINCL